MGWAPESGSGRSLRCADQTGSLSVAQPSQHPTRPDLATLREVEQRILWLAVRMVDHANRRPKSDVKVGGHQASSASMVSLMTALWFGHLRADDKVAVKPHASPVYHAIKYLTGELDQSWLTTLRQKGGLQAYPSRTKDPDVTDFSTGSVGLGAVAPLFAAATRRYVDAHFPGVDGDRPPARHIATVGDAELDEGNVWEAIADPAMQGLGNVTLVVDLNRQSLDRVIPEIQATRLQSFFADAGWHVAEAKWGHRLLGADPVVRDHITSLRNEAYQELFTLPAARLRDAFLSGADAAVGRAVADLDDAALAAVVFDLGGHDHGLLLDTLASCDAEIDRPSVVFAYTVKGWGLPMAGDPMNHSALLTPAQIDEFRGQVGLTEQTEWDRFDPESDAGRLCASVGAEVNNTPPPPRVRVTLPANARRLPSTGSTSTQESFGRVLSSLGALPEVAARIVTTSPDVSVSTNLGGWINKAGVFAPTEEPDHGGAERLLQWAPKPSGQHIELGLSEMNLFLMLGGLGLAHEHHGEVLLPVGTVYDPFVLRGLDALIYALYNGARFVFAGTPAGVTLAPEGGAHQSTVTASVGMELPNLDFVEPSYAGEVDWLLCDGIDALTRPGHAQSLYLRLSTRPIDQAPFAAALARLGEDRMRADVLAGGYRLIEPAAGDTRPAVTIATCGPMAPEALAAAAELDAEGVAATVLVLSSPDRLHRGWRATFIDDVRSSRVTRRPSHLHRLIPPAERQRPIISLHDADPHALAWLGSAIGTRQLTLGVDRFGESGTIAELHATMGIAAADVVNAALLALSDV
ncbi:MAG: pyruvate dehydrogenase E1 component [Nitriliruptoraceae bacterium]|jgi:pyruvate dehydrogenase E1 component